MHTDGPIPFPSQYLEYFRLFNARAFFEAHETLEDLWIMEVGELRNYYKGLIMMAVAILHWQRGNVGGAQRLYRDARAYLAAYPERIEGFELGGFLRRMDVLFAPLLSHGGQAVPPRDADLPTLTLFTTAG